MKRPLIVSDALRNFIRHLPPLLKRKIKYALAEIIENSLAGKELSEELAGLRSYKIGRIRIVYRIDSALITLIAVGPRKTIYQKAALEIRRGDQGKS